MKMDMHYLLILDYQKKELIKIFNLDHFVGSYYIIILLICSSVAYLAPEMLAKSGHG